MHELKPLLADTAGVTSAAEHGGGITVSFQLELARAFHLSKFLLRLWLAFEIVIDVIALLKDVMAPDVRDLVSHRASQITGVGPVGAEGGTGYYYGAAGRRPTLNIAKGVTLAYQFVPTIAIALVGVELGKHLTLIRLAEPPLLGKLGGVATASHHESDRLAP